MQPLSQAWSQRQLQTAAHKLWLSEIRSGSFGADLRPALQTPALPTSFHLLGGGSRALPGTMLKSSRGTPESTPSVGHPPIAGGKKVPPSWLFLEHFLGELSIKLMT